MELKIYSCKDFLKQLEIPPMVIANNILTKFQQRNGYQESLFHSHLTGPVKQKLEYFTPNSKLTIQIMIM